MVSHASIAELSIRHPSEMGQGVPHEARRPGVRSHLVRRQHVEGTGEVDGDDDQRIVDVL